jgi:hypothetical protein
VAEAPVVKYRFVAWNRLDISGSGVASVDFYAGEHAGIDIDAVEIVKTRRSRYGVRLRIFTDAEPRTESAFVYVLGQRPWHSIEVERVEDGAWKVNGRRRRELDACEDLDIAATPLTNTFPIRRLGLAVGKERTIRVAWLDVPSLRVIPVEQTYRRLGPVEGQPGVEAWEYSDPAHGTYRLTVDEDGLVIDYEGLAERIGRRRA